MEAKHDKLDRLLRKAAGQVPVTTALRATALCRLRVQVFHLKVSSESVDCLLRRRPSGCLRDTVFYVAELPFNMVRVLETRHV